MRERIKKRSWNNKASRDKVAPVHVSFVKNGSRFVQIFAFTDHSHEKINGTGFVALEVDRDSNRLYFIPADKNEGYTLAKTLCKSVMQIRICSGDKKATKIAKAGNYKLELDEADNSYYIDCSENTND